VPPHGDVAMRDAMSFNGITVTGA